jgi:hypothetical protein
MKTCSSLLKIILLTGLFLCDNTVFSQGKFELSGGMGWPEMTNLKIKYGKIIQVGICQTLMVQSLYPDYTKKIHLEATAAELYYHFGSKPKFTAQPPWYVFGGLGCLWGHDGDETEIYFYPRIGRSVNFSKRIGINIDAGAFLPISKGARDFFDSPVYPSGSISFFVRL